MESTFGENLKAARKKRGMVQKKLGEYTGVGQVTIANYEKGIRFPGEETLKSLAEVLNVSLDYLMSVDSSVDPGHGVRGDSSSESFSIDVLFERLLDSSLVSGKRYLQDWRGTRAYSLEETFDTIIIPLLIEVGERWSGGRISVAEEHLISAKVREFIVLLGDEAESELGYVPKNGKVWLGFAAPGEEHDMVLLMISHLMKLRGWDVVFLGIGIPLPALLDAISQYRPEVVASSITLERNRNGFEAYLSSIHTRLKTDCRVIAGGSGLSGSNNEAIPGIYGIANSIHEAISLAEE